MAAIMGGKTRRLGAIEYTSCICRKLGTRDSGKDQRKKGQSIGLPGQSRPKGKVAKDGEGVKGDNPLLLLRQSWRTTGKHRYHW